MDFETLLYNVEDRVATITLNRPERLNAIDYRLPRELRDAVETADDDPHRHVDDVSAHGELLEFSQHDAASR